MDSLGPKFHDLIYLDVSIVESILAQLQEGLVKTFIDEEEATSTASAEGRVSIAALLGFSSKLEGGKRGLARDEWVLHDFVLQRTIELLAEENLLTDLSHLNREEMSDSSIGFVTLSGSFGLFDSAMFPIFANLAKIFPKVSQYSNESASSIENSEEGKPRGLLQQIQESIEANTRKAPKELQVFVDMAKLVSVLFPDMVRSGFSTDHLEVRGLLRREYLREDAQSLIFKYGLPSRDDWNLLALITSIPDREDEQRMQSQLEDLERLSKERSQGNSAILSATESFDGMVQSLNIVMQQLGGARYPEIVVAPIAIYREVWPTVD